jgi:hypothetical protein
MEGEKKLIKMSEKKGIKREDGGGRGKSNGKCEIPRSVRRPETRLASRLASPPPSQNSLSVFYTRRFLR